MSKMASNIIHYTDYVRLKSLINRDNRKDACTMRDACLGLTLLQIAVIADNVPAGITSFVTIALDRIALRAIRMPVRTGQ